MANRQHLAKLRKGVDVWNTWRAEHPHVTPDLREVDFSGANLSKADLSGASFTMANLGEADLTGANLTVASLRSANLRNARLFEVNLSHANLSGANLTWADLREADLTGADLSGANLSKAGLSRANLTRADLTGANFEYAVVGWTTFANVDLSSVNTIQFVKHLGPSTIGIDTFYRSHGDIPDAFLRGCGVPEQFIVYARSLVGRAIEFYSCFISYSTTDEEFANRLYADLQAQGVRCWFAPHNIQGGKKIHEQIDEAIRVHDRLLLILSEHSMNSEWVKTEIAKARKREVSEKRRTLFPIRLVSFELLQAWECFDGDLGKDSAREIREFYVPDFSVWKTDHDAYQREFEKLLRDLKSDTKTPPPGRAAE